ncbi:hypothetical protein POVCU2_0004250 [Plasmodium ovale curtisi]|uniref:Uncharacterized protein n=1 Tax=Plasmodium ovale curtisi TaxID=864141 RepID=A0A1A8VN82_PLAOA|nr:hypothetical protein POVCU2_0004250 [Plasmodium ovale curtisi]SBS80877.1 hypothetical protein POVCU1_003480 [Plasmodium ovale curtisi]
MFVLRYLLGINYARKSAERKLTPSNGALSNFVRLRRSGHSGISMRTYSCYYVKSSTDFSFRMYPRANLRTFDVFTQMKIAVKQRSPA